MWLINVDTLELEEFYGKNIPEYAILSHTWDSEEISFQDMRTRRGSVKTSWTKVEGCCSRAQKDGFQYCWVDTCCIDKTSSAELSEAINSMFKFYQDSVVCYVYLSGISTWNPCPETSFQWAGFEQSRWFTRGWTLQELIAPSSVIFYAKDWSEIGTKLSLDRRIEGITTIPASVLRSSHPVSSYNVATRMSWASARSTTRDEDMAYCLFGLFNVHMPLLYGEGSRAFIRLQEEILRTIDDLTIFAWAEEINLRHCGFLANSPAPFRGLPVPAIEVSQDKRLSRRLSWNTRRVLSEPQLLLPEHSNQNWNYSDPCNLGGWRPLNAMGFSMTEPPQATSNGIKVTLPASPELEVGGGEAEASSQRLCIIATSFKYCLAVRAIPTSRPGCYLRYSSSKQGLQWIEVSKAEKFSHGTMYLRTFTPPLQKVKMSGLLTVSVNQFSGNSMMDWSVDEVWGQQTDTPNSFEYDYTLSVQGGEPIGLLISSRLLGCSIMVRVFHQAFFCFCSLEKVSDDELKRYPPRSKGRLPDRNLAVVEKGFGDVRTDRATLDIEKLGSGGLINVTTVTASVKRIPSTRIGPWLAPTYRLDISTS